MMKYKQNKQKENENVRAQNHTSSRVCKRFKNEVVGGCLAHHRSGGDHH